MSKKIHSELFDGSLLPTLTKNYKLIIYFEMKIYSHYLIYDKKGKQYYYVTEDIPKEILLQIAIDELSQVKSWLSAEKGQKVKILIPERVGHLFQVVACCDVDKNKSNYHYYYYPNHIDLILIFIACGTSPKCLVI